MRSNTYRRLIGILLLIAIIVLTIAYKMYKASETQSLKLNLNQYPSMVFIEVAK